MNYLPDIEAEITFLSTQAGGRQGYVATGYRGQFFYNGGDWDAQQTFIGCERVEPGESVKATLRFASPHAHDEKLEVGTVFLIREGSTTVGYGKVTSILNLVAHANEARAKEASQ